MSTLAGLQREFRDALLDPGLPPPPGLRVPDGADLGDRFAVHRNNVVAGLVDALAERFPATRRIVGDAFFRAMARIHVTAHPPRGPVLAMLGDDLPGFIAAFPPAGDLPYLADVARLEAARTRAHHAADASPIDPAVLATLAPDRLAEARLALHPSVSVIASAWPIVTVWAMNSGERPVAPIADWAAEAALVSRPQDAVLVRALPAGGAPFLERIAAGASLGDAVAAAMAAVADFDLTAGLVALIEAGAVTAVRPGPTPAEACP